MTNLTIDRITQYLARQPHSSAEEISRALEMTKAAVQYHLKTLLKTGEVNRAEFHPKGRGRPIHRYRLTHLRSPTEIPFLAGSLLDTLFHPSDSIHERSAIIKQIAAHIFAGLVEPAGSPTIHERYNSAMQALNRRSYQSRWEIRKNGPCFLLRNCPYASLLKDHPELCEIDRAGLEQLTGLSLQQTTWINFDQPGSACEFHQK